MKCSESGDGGEVVMKMMLATEVVTLETCAVVFVLTWLELMVAPLLQRLL